MRGLYSIFDRGVGKYMMPFPAETDHDAIRQCKAVVNSDRKSPMTDYPEDYDLYFVGWFNEEECKLQSAQAPRLVTMLKELKNNV